MFTGIVREQGTVKRFGRAGSLYTLDIGSIDVSREVVIGDSVAVNGACLTVTAKKSGLLRFDVMEETVRKTCLMSLKTGDSVNLEGSLKANGTLGGHFVLGHVDCVGSIKDLRKKGGDLLMEISFSPEFAALVVEKGSITVDGVSLTVGSVTAGSLTVYLIPHTLDTTTLGAKKRGDSANLEFDIIGKYIARSGALKDGGRITEDFLKARGF